jgi:periplasmic divalent cation tolerance protein
MKSSIENEGRLVLILSTVAKIEDARRIADHLVEKRLAACVTLLPGAESHYVWDSQKQSSTEIVLLIKTPVAQADVCRAELEKVHPYDCPEILSFISDAVNPAYLSWAEANANSEA